MGPRGAHGVVRGDAHGGRGPSREARRRDAFSRRGTRRAVNRRASHAFRDGPMARGTRLVFRVPMLPTDRRSFGLRVTTRGLVGDRALGRCRAAAGRARVVVRPSSRDDERSRVVRNRGRAEPHRLGSRRPHSLCGRVHRAQTGPGHRGRHNHAVYTEREKRCFTPSLRLRSEREAQSKLGPLAHSLTASPS